jgi:hypothetical protein
MISAPLIVSERLATGWQSDRKHCFPGEAKIGSIRLTLKEGSCYMSSRFFYVQLKFTPKSGLRGLPMTKQHGADYPAFPRLENRVAELVKRSRSDDKIFSNVKNETALIRFTKEE